MVDMYLVIDKLFGDGFPLSQLYHNCFVELVMIVSINTGLYQFSVDGGNIFEAIGNRLGNFLIVG